MMQWEVREETIPFSTTNNILYFYGELLPQTQAVGQSDGELLLPADPQ